MSFNHLSICNMTHLNCDTIVVDPNTNRLVFFSVIGYPAAMKSNISKIKEESKPYAYMRGVGSMSMVRCGYELEQKKQSNGDYIHTIGFLKDRFTEHNNGTEELMTYIYHITGDNAIEDRNQKIYDKLYKYFSIPMIPEWKDYIIEQLTSNRKIYDLRMYTGHEQRKFNACGLYVNSADLSRIITTGLQNKEISIQGSNEPSILMESISGLNDYLNVFGETLAAKIQSSFRPKFIPGVDSYSESINDYDDAIFSTGIEMYEAQKSLVQSAVNNLNKEDTTFIVAEMGSGNTMFI